MNLTQRQRELLEDMAAVCDAGMIWYPHLRGCYGSDAQTIKALWRKGLAKQHERTDGNSAGYNSVITDAGRSAIAEATGRTATIGG